LFLFYCLYITASWTQELTLLPDPTNDSLALEYMDLFLGEFPCIHPNISGSRRILRFASVIANEGEEIALRNITPKINYKIDNFSNATLLAGTIDLPCLRDTECRGGGSRTYYTCTPPAVSSKCETVTARHTICHCIDITPLPQSSYLLYLNIANSTIELQFDITTMPRISRGGKARVATTMTVNVVIILLVACTPWCLWRERNSPKELQLKDE